MSILNETFTDPAIVKVSCHIHQNSLVVFVWLLDFGGSCSVCFILLLLLLYFCLLIFLVVLHLMVKEQKRSLILDTWVWNPTVLTACSRNVLHVILNFCCFTRSCTVLIQMWSGCKKTLACTWWTCLILTKLLVFSILASTLWTTCWSCIAVWMLTSSTSWLTGGYGKNWPLRWAELQGNTYPCFYC